MPGWRINCHAYSLWYAFKHRSLNRPALRANSAPEKHAVNFSSAHMLLAPSDLIK